MMFFNMNIMLTIFYYNFRSFWYLLWQQLWFLPTAQILKEQQIIRMLCGLFVVKTLKERVQCFLLLTVLVPASHFLSLLEISGKNVSCRLTFISTSNALSLLNICLSFSVSFCVFKHLSTKIFVHSLTIQILPEMFKWSFLYWVLYIWQRIPNLWLWSVFIYLSHENAWT